MPHDWDKRDDEVAAGANSRMPDCGALAVSYRPSDALGVTTSLGSSRARAADSPSPSQKLI